MRNARAKLAYKLSTAQSSVANTLINAKAHASKSKDDDAEGLAWFKKSTKLLWKADTLLLLCVKNNVGDAKVSP